MSELPPWDDLESGSECPLCAPRPERNEFIYFVRKLNVSSLYLSKNQASYGTGILIFDPKHAVRLDQLSEDEWLRYAADLQRAESVIMQVANPDHINVELLGNAVPHLHWHIIPRYKSEVCWGGPIWTTSLSEQPVRHLDESEYGELANKMNLAFDRLVAS